MGKLGDDFMDVMIEALQHDNLNLDKLREIRLMLNMVQPIVELFGIINPKTGRVSFSLTEFDGDITAHGGDLNANTNATTQDARLNLQTQQVTRAAVWYDQDQANLVVQNEATDSPIVLNAINSAVNFFDDDDDEDVFIANMSNHGWQLLKVGSDPSYVDGYAIIYFYSDGAGADELRVRGKIGATETQATLANLSP